MSAAVVVVGSFNVDHAWTSATLPRAGETLSGQYASGPGGKGFNQATAAARAGASASFVCALGDDAGGQLARELASADGIALLDQRSDAPTGTAGIFVDSAGRNCIVLGPGANAALSAAHVAAHGAAIASAAVLLAQLEVPAAAVAEALHRGRDVGAATVLNPAPANAEVPEPLLALATFLTPNETEFASLITHHLGQRIDAEAVAALDQASLHGLCRQLLPQGSVVLTLGGAGCFVSHPEGDTRGDPAHYRLPAEPAQVVDTTGAGDAFNGALAAALALSADAPFAQHARFAARYAALSTERPGAAASMPRCDEVAARFGNR
ncbi:MAG: ribokinase [Pseudomonadota bacterium]|nr:ribokinase [Pseudomonadota bacterium]